MKLFYIERKAFVYCEDFVYRAFLFLGIVVESEKVSEREIERIEDKMKKRVYFVALFSALLLSLMACGKKEEEVVKTEDYNVDDYVVELAEYKGVEYKKEKIEVTDEELKAISKSLLAKHPEKKMEGTIKNGDVANIDFVGKRDGVAFEGGTSKDFSLEIGSGRFIPGFEEGLVGSKVGETVDLNLKFPEDYHEESLKGAAVVFTVTINHIEVPAKELTDEIVSQNTEFKTVKEYEEKNRKDIIENKKIRASVKEQTEVLTKVIKGSTIKMVPKKLKETYLKEYNGFYEARAKEANLSLEEYVKTAMKIEMDAFKQNAEKFAEEMGEQKLIIDAIVKKEKMEFNEEEYQIELEEYYQNSGYAAQMNKETFEKTVGKKNIENVVLAKKVLKLLVDEGKAVE